MHNKALTEAQGSNKNRGGSSSQDRNKPVQEAVKNGATSSGNKTTLTGNNQGALLQNMLSDNPAMLFKLDSGKTLVIEPMDIDLELASYLAPEQAPEMRGLATSIMSLNKNIQAQVLALTSSTVNIKNSVEVLKTIPVRLEQRCKEVANDADDKFTYNNTKIEEIISQMKVLQADHDRLKDENGKLWQEHRLLQTDVNCIYEDCVKINKRVSGLEQHSRLNNIIIRGVRFNDADEDIYEKIIEIAAELQVQITHDDIDIAHILYEPEPTDCPPIIIRFSNRWKKILFYDAAKLLKDKLNDSKLGPGKIFVDNHLSPINAELFYQARQLKNYGFRYIWERDYKVFVRENEKTQSIRLANLGQVLKCQEGRQTTMDEEQSNVNQGSTQSVEDMDCQDLPDQQIVSSQIMDKEAERTQINRKNRDEALHIRKTVNQRNNNPRGGSYRYPNLNPNSQPRGNGQYQVVPYRGRARGGSRGGNRNSYSDGYRTSRNYNHNNYNNRLPNYNQNLNFSNQNNLNYEYYENQASGFGVSGYNDYTNYDNHSNFNNHQIMSYSRVATMASRPQRQQFNRNQGGRYAVPPTTGNRRVISSPEQIQERMKFQRVPGVNDRQQISDSSAASQSPAQNEAQQEGGATTENSQQIVSGQKPNESSISKK